MPRLSLYRPNKTADYEFLDKVIYEQFSIGGTDIFVHKFLGPDNPSVVESTADKPRYNEVAETNIQDMLFLENRDRKYDSDIYEIRGIYNIQDNDFNLSQFGLFLSSDTLYLTVHINSSVKTIGRKLISGDVVELPHLIDEHALNDFSIALKRFYVIEEVSRSSEGFSQTWYPHLYRLKLTQIIDSQQYKDILNKSAEDDEGNTLRDVLSTYNQEKAINDAVIAQAEVDAPKSGYDTSYFYTLQVDEAGKPELVSTGADSAIDRANTPPERSGYSGYLLGDGLPPNGEVFGSGIGFPLNSQSGDYFLRTDFFPNRLFRYNGSRWTKMEDDVRQTLTNTDSRDTQRTSFINNTKTSTIGGTTVTERQSLSKALSPRADN